MGYYGLIHTTYLSMPNNCSGALTVDEAVTLSQGVASGNSGTVAFWLLPQWHSSMNRTSTLKNRRLLEDKVLGSLAMSLCTCIFLSINVHPYFLFYSYSKLASPCWANMGKPTDEASILKCPYGLMVILKPSNFGAIQFGRV